MSERFGIPDHAPQHAPDHALKNPTPQGSWGGAPDLTAPTSASPGYGGGAVPSGPTIQLRKIMVLAVVPLQLWFARDAYSELVVQVVVLGGIWLYLEARARRRWGMALVAGGVLASSALARVDSLAILAGVLALVALGPGRASLDARRLRTSKERADARRPS